MQFVYMLYMICGSSFYIICSFSHPSIQFRDVITMLWSLWSPLQSRPWFGHFEQQWPQCIAQGCSERKPPSLWVARLPSPFPIFVLFNSLTSSFWPSFIEFSQSVGGFETFGDVSSSFFGHHFEAFGPRRLGRAPGGETLKSKKIFAEDNAQIRQCLQLQLVLFVSVLNCFNLSSTFGTVFVCMKPGRWIFQPPRWSLMQMAIRRQSWSQNSVFMPD